MTIDQLQQHELWQRITPGQRKFLLTYIEAGGDKLKAGRQCWPNTKSDATLRDMVNRALRKPSIRKLLAYYRGATVTDELFPMTRRELSDLIARRLRTPQGITNAAFIRLTELFIDLRGWNPAAKKEAPEDTTPAGRGDSVDDLVLAIERRARQDIED